MAKIRAFSQILSKIDSALIDSSIFIYKFEQNKQFEPLASIIFDQASKNKLVLRTSTITVAEVLAKPMELNNLEVVYLYETVFNGLPNFQIINIDYEIAKLTAQIRGNYKLLLADALQIAVAISTETSAFITNDSKLKIVKEIKVICLKDFV